MRQKLIIPLIFIVLLSSCDYKPVHPALWTIGKNKSEFQKVLDYYSNPRDSLKLRAAEFLIENMDNHYYYSPKNENKIDRFFQNLEAQISLPKLRNKKLYELLRIELVNTAVSKGLLDGCFHKPKYRKRTDIKTIKAEFLIENIEYAFKAWDFPWARTYSFDDFCRYILPYRYGNEAPGPWRKTIYEQFKWIADSVEYTNNPMEAASLVNKQFRYVLSYSRNLTRKGFKPNISSHLEASAFGNCREQAGLGVCVLRALGIPATVVSIPQWGHFSGGHEIVGMLDSENEWHCFDFGGKGPEVDINIHPPKMFFKQFDKMHRFKPVLTDASNILMKVVDLEVKVNADDDDEIYLCVFGKSSWIPLFKGENMKSKIIFEDVGYRSKMYLAAVKSRGKLKAVSPLFLPDTLGNITYYKPDHTKLFTTSLSRKYKGFKKDMPRLKSLLGGEFSISDTKDFENKKQLYKIDKILNYDNNTIKCPEKEGKYFRYDFPQSLDSIFDGPAEISFYTTIDNTLKKIEGKYFGSPQLSEKHIKLITDDDMLTYVEVWDCQEDLEIETGRYILRKDKQPIWIGLEVDTATVVTHVGICPRNDKNGIYPGMHYELFYWDDSWKSLGEKVATSDTISYDGIPENAVLWLRNLDEGREERIFTIKDGNQIWW